MNGRKLQDRLHFGLGLAARHIGLSADAFRPNGPLNPLDKVNRFLRLPATFVPARGSPGRSNAYGDPLWHGIFDASYTRSGDYLVLEGANFFIVSQEALLPVLCVRANHIVSVKRRSMPTGTAANSYGGYMSGSSVTVMEGWPASVLSENRSSTSTANLPTDQGVPYWNILLPAVGHLILSPGDFINDELGRTAVIVGSELSSLGWRISAKVATT